MTDIVEICEIRIDRKDLNVVHALIKFMREADGLSDKHIYNFSEIIIEKLRHSQIVDQEASHDPQTNPRSHLDRFDRLLHTANQLLIQTQEQAMKAGANGFFLPFLIPKVHLRQIQSNFEQIAALTQVLKINLDNIRDSLPKKESNHD
jgi:hypothetical protein